MDDTCEKTAQSHMIDLSAGRFHYLSWNAERVDLPGVLLLHGLTSSARSWVRVGPALAVRYRVYALDQRGHGESIKPVAGMYSLQQTAADAAAFLAALELERPILVGHSWGGATALVLASGTWLQKSAHQFSHVILEDPSHNFQNDSGEKALASIKNIDRPTSELRSEIVASNLGMSEDEIEGRVDAFHKVTREAITSIFSQAGQMGELLPLLAEITAPTLLMRADAALGSTLDDADWEQAKRYLPTSSQAIQIIGATHTVHWSKFDEFMQKVHEFLINGDGLSAR